MKSDELRQKFLRFFEEREHKVIPSASLVPSQEVELSGTQKVLFTTAGMHPLIPYLLGQKHPEGKRLVNVQKCLRTDDIDEIGDSVHCTFFEMLGNWSLGDPNLPDGIGKGGYWKKESIAYSWEFLTKELGLDKERIYVSVFEGDKSAPFDEESFEAWKEIGIPPERIFKYGKKDNWWGPVGEIGPCGPDTEIFYDVIGGDLKGEESFTNSERFIEIWNDVFMEYDCRSGGSYKPLKQKNVDTGMGLERMLMVLQGKKNIYETDLFSPIVNEIRNLASSPEDRAIRIIADHLRASTFVLAEGVVPSNLERGYILRRLIRRAIRYGKLAGVDEPFVSKIAQSVIEVNKKYYSGLLKESDFIIEQLNLEERRFEDVISEGLKKSHRLFGTKIPILDGKYKKIMQTADKREIFREFYQNKKEASLLKFGAGISSEDLIRATISGKEAFDLYQSFGFPIEMIVELAQAENLVVDIESFEEEFKKHQEVSRKGMEKKFAGGLGGKSPKIVAGHTATHLLQAALRQILDDHVHQTGSNITEERIRFDFSHSEKLTDEQIKKVEDLVNEKIKDNLPVKKEMMTPPDAKKLGAIGLFEERYTSQVSVYSVGEFSKEICGGPHVSSTKEIGHLKIVKEEGLGSGKRRIYAELD